MIANTWVTVYRGDDVNEYGDPIDLAGAAVDDLTHIPFAITEKATSSGRSSTVTYGVETDEQRSVRYGIGRCRGRRNILVDDLIKDERTGTTWSVMAVSDRGFTFYGSGDQSLDLRAV